MYGWFPGAYYIDTNSKIIYEEMARQSCIIYQNGLRATSGFEMCFSIGSLHLWCRGSQPKHVSNPDSATKTIKPHMMYDCCP